MVDSRRYQAKGAILNTPRLVLLTVLAALTLGADDQGCESQSPSSVDADTVHTAYWLYYDSDRHITLARAQFRCGGPVPFVNCGDSSRLRKRVVPLRCLRDGLYRDSWGSAFSRLDFSASIVMRTG